MNEKILVVDDEMELADLLEVYLKNDGYIVYKYYNGRDALKGIEENLPLNIYQDYFNRPNLLPNLLRGLVFDGTVYHLWHLPAAMLGLAIVWRLVEKLDYPKGLAVAAVLYLVGLFGDSYYGIREECQWLRNFMICCSSSSTIPEMVSSLRPSS